jgi:hypothetical protein
MVIEGLVLFHSPCKFIIPSFINESNTKQIFLSQAPGSFDYLILHVYSVVGHSLDNEVAGITAPMELAFFRKRKMAYPEPTFSFCSTR